METQQEGRKRFHFLYRTTNTINGKYYIGVHSTWDLDDGYLGSGMRITRAVRKYGRDHFLCEVIQFFEKREDAYLAEIEEVSRHLGSDLCMNLHPGGNGGWSVALERRLTRHRDDPEWSAAYREQCRQTMLRRVKGYPEQQERFMKAGQVGRPTPEATRQKQSASKRGQHTGSGNSQHGTRWVHDMATLVARKVVGTLPEGCAEGRKPRRAVRRKPFRWMSRGAESRYVRIEEVDAHLDDGWSIGRIGMVVH